MLQSKKVLVTTTSSIDGLKIIKHLNPISAHIVLGTNVLSDFIGSLSDVFGGKSNTYQKRLSMIYNDAIKKLKQSCYDIGGNCVLGLKIDIDEISGKGKSMFMITAVGTAVVVESNKQESKSVQRIDEKVSVDELNELRKRKSIINQVANNKLLLNNDTWSFITNNQIVEVLPYLLSLISKAETDNNYNVIDNEFMDKLKTYIDVLPDDVKHSVIYKALHDEANLQVKLKYRKIMKDLYLLDYNGIIDLIKSKDFTNKKQVLAISTLDKKYYDYDDIKHIDNLIQLINSTFQKRGEVSTKKQLLSSKNKDVWICECGKTNNLDKSYCSNCENDIYGFRISDLKPINVVKHLEEKKELVQEILK